MTLFSDPILGNPSKSVMIRNLPNISLSRSLFCCLHRGPDFAGFNDENVCLYPVEFKGNSTKGERNKRALMGDKMERRSSQKEGTFTNGFTPVQEQMISTTVPQHTMSFLSTENYDNQNENDLKIVRDIAKSLAKDIVWSYIGRSSKPPNSYAATLRRTVNEIMEKHEILFKSIVNKLDIDENNGYSTFVNVVEEMFQDSAINWGRLVSVYAFAASLAKFARSKGMADKYVDNIIELSGNYVANKLGKWILSQGGWVGLTLFILLILFINQILIVLKVKEKLILKK